METEILQDWLINLAKKNTLFINQAHSKQVCWFKKYTADSFSLGLVGSCRMDPKELWTVASDVAQLIEHLTVTYQIQQNTRLNVSEYQKS